MIKIFMEDDLIKKIQSEKFFLDKIRFGTILTNLKVQGIKICLNDNSLTINPSFEKLSIKKIIKNLNTKQIGRKIKIFNTIDSTNTYLKFLNEKVGKNGYVVLAEKQTAGRGRFDRKFFSLYKQGIFMSILIKIEKVEILQFITFIAALSVVKAINKIYKIDVSIKWVNDILYADKKLCGILTETTYSQKNNSDNFVVLGIGVNTGLIANEVKEIATSLFLITGKINLRNKLVSQILNCLEEYYYILERKDYSYIIKEYKNHSCVIGRNIKVSGANNFDAEVIDIDEFGRLVVKDENNKILFLNSGEIVLYKK